MESPKRVSINKREMNVFMWCLECFISEEDNKENKSHFPLILFVWKLVEIRKVAEEREGVQQQPQHNTTGREKGREMVVSQSAMLNNLFFYWCLFIYILRRRSPNSNFLFDFIQKKYMFLHLFIFLSH